MSWPDNTVNVFSCRCAPILNNFRLQVCDMGQLKVKNLKQVGAGAPQLGGGKYISIRKRPVRIKRNLLVQCVFPLNVLWLL